MKRIVLMTAAGLLMSSSLVANASGVLEAFQAVASSDTVKSITTREEAKGWNLKNIELARTYRCISCYGFNVVFSKYDHERGVERDLEHRVGTRWDNSKQKVTVGIEAQ